MMLPLYDVLVIRSKMQVGADIIPFAKNLKLVIRAGSGLDNLDLDVLDEHQIAYANCPEGNRDAVAEQAIGMLLAFSANIVKGNRETSAYKWDREGNRGFEIKGKTIGIVGFGNTGSALAKKLTGFECEVIAYDKYVSGFGSEHVEEVEIDELLSRADVISFHVPLTDETDAWLDRTFFEKLAKPIVLLNLSRGKILVTKDAISALKSGKLKALGLDVLENEKMGTWSAEEKAEFDTLKEFENVIVTPHVGGWTTESYRKISEVAAARILSHFQKTIPFVKDEDNISDIP